MKIPVPLQRTILQDKTSWRNKKQIKTYQLAALKMYYDRKEMNLQFWKNIQGILISVRLVVNAEWLYTEIENNLQCVIFVSLMTLSDHPVITIALSNRKFIFRVLSPKILVISYNLVPSELYWENKIGLIYNIWCQN